MRNSESTRQKIMKAAEEEYSLNGLHGARVDKIAMSADVNKRMIYAYYGCKEELYKCVLCEVYSRLTELEKKLPESFSSCQQAITGVIDTYFDFLSNNHSFVNLVMWENLNQGMYLETIKVDEIKKPGLFALRAILEEGINKGEIREDIDIDQVILSLNSFCFSYFANFYTLPKVFGITAEDVSSRKAHIRDVMIKYISK